MTIKTRLIYSPNFDAKKRKQKNVRFLIFHYTGIKKEKNAIKKLTKIQSQVSAHYLPCLTMRWLKGVETLELMRPPGELLQSADVYLRPRHRSLAKHHRLGRRIR